jgi:hypothetical protein
MARRNQRQPVRHRLGRGRLAVDFFVPADPAEHRRAQKLLPFLHARAYVAFVNGLDLKTRSTQGIQIVIEAARLDEDTIAKRRVRFHPHRIVQEQAIGRIARIGVDDAGPLATGRGRKRPCW